MPNAWAKQRELQKLPTPRYDEMKTILLGIPNARDRALMIMCYLTAGRITEVCQSLTRNSIIFLTRKGRAAMVVTMPNRKSRIRGFKEIPVMLDHEGTLVDAITDFLNSIPTDSQIFPISRQRAWQIIRHYGFNPHYLRHIRLTHLVTVYDLNSQLLKRFAGWTSPKLADYYMELGYGDIADKL